MGARALRVHAKWIPVGGRPSDVGGDLVVRRHVSGRKVSPQQTVVSLLPDVAHEPVDGGPGRKKLQKAVGHIAEGLDPTPHREEQFQGQEAFDFVKLEHVVPFGDFRLFL
eukprot:189745_1